MENSHIIKELERNISVFKAHLEGLEGEIIRFKPDPEHWSILEILSHLYDEEVEDFRQRLDYMLHSPDILPPPIDPVNWVNDRRYKDNDYDKKLKDFIQARADSIAWLESLENPQWDNEQVHRRLGLMTAQKYLENWLAHDLLHIRQITRVKYLFLKKEAKSSIDYAGTW